MSDDKRLEILRAVRAGGSITQALQQLAELDGREIIKLQLVRLLDRAGTGDEAILDAEFVLDHMPTDTLNIFHRGQRYVYTDLPALHIDNDGNRTWILTARKFDY